MATYKDLIASAPKVLVDFSAEWCGPCKMLAPVLQDLAEETNGAVKIVKIDVDKNPGLAQSMQVMGVPTLVFYEEGEQKWRRSGFMTLNQLKSAVGA